MCVTVCGCVYFMRHQQVFGMMAQVLTHICIRTQTWPDAVDTLSLLSAAAAFQVCVCECVCVCVC